jgi:hypothetical protein
MTTQENWREPINEMEGSMASTLTEKINTLLESLKQPSTIKALGTLAGVVGLYIDPDKALEIVVAIQVFAALVNGFYDANPRKSIPEEKRITPEDVAKMVHDEITRMRAERAKVK